MAEQTPSSTATNDMGMKIHGGLPALVFQSEEGRALAVHRFLTWSDLLDACAEAVPVLLAHVDSPLGHRALAILDAAIAKARGHDAGGT